MAKKSGQIFSIDFVVAVIVFMLCLAFIDSFWRNAMSSAGLSVERNRLAATALVATDALMMGDGEPADWEDAPGSARSLGLAKKGSPNELDFAKLSNFTAMNESQARALLGLRPQYAFQVDSIDSALSYESGNDSGMGKKSMGITRYAVLNGEIVKVKLYVHN